MHACNLIAPCLPDEPLPEEPQEGVCAVTGQASLCISRKHLLSKSFTNLDLLRAPNSSLVSVSAYKTLTYKWERMSSWFCDGKEFKRLDRQGVRSLVLEDAYPERWAAYATTSYKKHGALWAQVNTPGKAVWRFETRDVDCSNSKSMLRVWDKLNKSLRAGISRPVMETLEPTHYTFKAVGTRGWLNFLEWARPLAKSALYQFLCYLLPSQEELKNE